VLPRSALRFRLRRSGNDGGVRGGSGAFRIRFRTPPGSVRIHDRPDFWLVPCRKIKAAADKQCARDVP
jgi:hypothetical protein